MLAGAPLHHTGAHWIEFFSKKLQLCVTNYSLKRAKRTEHVTLTFVRVWSVGLQNIC
jgi:hypothetical protein